MHPHDFTSSQPHTPIYSIFLIRPYFPILTRPRGHHARIPVDLTATPERLLPVLSDHIPQINSATRFLNIELGFSTDDQRQLLFHLRRLALLRFTLIPYCRCGDSHLVRAVRTPVAGASVGFTGALSDSVYESRLGGHRPLHCDLSASDNCASSMFGGGGGAVDLLRLNRLPTNQLALHD